MILECLSHYINLKKEELIQIEKGSNNNYIFNDLSSYLDELHKQCETLIKEDIEWEKIQSNEKIKNNELENAINIKEYELESKRQEIMFDSVIKTGMLALKTSLTINAGAATAFLSFIGYLLTRGNFQLVSLKSLAEVLSLFGWGAFYAALSTGVMYFTQFFYSKYENKICVFAGRFCHLFTIALISVSYWCFFAGLNQTKNIFLDATITKPYYYINKDIL